MRKPYDGIRPITSEFGYREFWIGGQLVKDSHGGIDIGGVFDVLAAATGTIIAIKKDGIISPTPNSNTPANYVILDHGGGLWTKYWHLGSVANISIGSRVAEGQKLGVSGRTGYASGDHLHFGVAVNGVNVNPRNYVNFNTLPVTSTSMEFVVAQSGWGLSHVAQAAGYPDAQYPSAWQRIAELNGYSKWEALQARFVRGDIIGQSLRVQPAASAPAVSNEQIDQKNTEIAQLKAELKKQGEDAETKYEALQQAEAEKDKLQQAEFEKLREESLARQSELSTQLQEELRKYNELQRTSIQISTDGFTDQVSQLAITAIAEEAKASGLKEKWHAWIDAHFSSNFVKQILKYTWPAWVFFLVAALVAWANVYQPTTDPVGSIIGPVVPVIATVGAAVIQFLLTNFDKNKDNKVDFADFQDVLQP